MGDWIHVHHCVIAADHPNALAFYERLESAEVDRGETVPTGLRWGFWSPRVVLVTTTSKWGSDPGFGPSLLDGLDAECLTHSEDEAEDAGAEVSAFERAVRDRLGAVTDFLWSDQPAVMGTLLAELPARATPVTTVAVLPPTAPRRVRLPPAAARALADLPYSKVVHGFLTASGACFAVASFDAPGDERDESPLFTPLAASRQRGPGAWAINQSLDGNELLPVHVGSRAELWMVERHGAHGAWQLRPQRLAVARRAIEAGSAEERQAGCSLARRWGLEELSAEVARLQGDVDHHVAAAASFAHRVLSAPPPVAPHDEPAPGPELTTTGAQVLALVAQRRGASPAELERAISLLDDHRLGGPARLVVAAQGPIDRPDLAQRVLEGAGELAELHAPFLESLGDELFARACARFVAEMAYASTRTSYWMVRYGAPGEDGPPAGIENERPAWDDEPVASAARILFWARRTIEAAQDPAARRAALGSLVAFSELLGATRANRVWWVPPPGVIRARLDALLRRSTLPPEDAEPLGSADLAELEARAAEIGALYRGMAPGEHHQAFEGESAALLAGVPSPLLMWSYSSYGQGAPTSVAWVANNLAWRRYERGAYAEALAPAVMAVTYATGHEPAMRDTLVRVLLALGRTEEGYRALRCGLARTPSSEALSELAQSEGYRAWLARR